MWVELKITLYRQDGVVRGVLTDSWASELVRLNALCKTLHDQAFAGATNVVRSKGVDEEWGCEKITNCEKKF